MERAEYNRHSRARMAETAKRRVETYSAGRAGAHRPSEALHPTRSSDVLPRIARERVPTVPHVAKRVEMFQPPDAPLILDSGGLGALASQFLTICLTKPLYDAGPNFAVASPIDEFFRAPMWSDIGSPSGGSSFPKCPDDQKRIIIQHHQ